MAVVAHQKEDLPFICKLLTLYQPSDDSDLSIFLNQRLVLRERKDKGTKTLDPLHLAAKELD